MEGFESFSKLVNWIVEIKMIERRWHIDGEEVEEAISKIRMYLFLERLFFFLLGFIIALIIFK